MKKVLLIMLTILFFSLLSFGQGEAGLSVKYKFLPETENIEFSEIKTAFTFPIFIKEIILANRIGVDFFEMDTGDKYSSFSFEKSTKLSYALVLPYKYKENWSFICVSEVGLSSDDFKTKVERYNYEYNFLFLAQKKVNPKFTFGIGIIASDNFIFPIATIKYKINSKTEFEAGKDIFFKYRYNKLFDLGINVLSYEKMSYSNRKKNISNNVATRNSIEHSAFESFLFTESHMSKFTHLRIRLGLAYNRKAEFFNDTKRINTIYLDEQIFFEMKFLLGIKVSI